MRISKNFAKILKERIYRASLLPGLSIIFIPRRGIQKKVAVLSVLYGSLDVKFKKDGDIITTPEGIAHFLEHQLFKKHKGDSLMEFAKYGASSNASTDYNLTSYYFSCTHNFDECLKELFRLVFLPEFSDTRVNVERSIIEQELLMYEDMPDYKSYKNLLSALYVKHPVRIDIGGTCESIKKIDAKLLEDCYRTFYTPANMVLVIAGDHDVQEIFTLIEKEISARSFQVSTIERARDSEPEGVKTDTIKQIMVVSRPKVLIGFKDNIARDNNPAIVARDIKTLILHELLFGRSSKFFNREYERGLIDSEFGASYTTDHGYGFSLIGADTDKPDEFIEKVLEEIQKTKKKRFSSKDVERIKRKLIGRFISAFDSPEACALLMIDLERRKVDLDFIISFIKKLRREDIEERLHTHFIENNKTISIVSPG